MLNASQRMKGFPSTLAILYFFIAVCWIIWATCFSALASIDIPTRHLDGAFQTASSLHRLDAGQFPGRDFYPYLGIGLIFTLYPLFKAFGAHLAASVFSAQFMVLLVGTLSTAFIWHMVWRPRSFTSSIVASCILFLAPISLSSYFPLRLPNSFVMAYTPGNSLRPLRAAAPYLIGIAYYFFILNAKPKFKYTLSGLLTGLVLLWSNDFGLPTAILFSFIICANALYHDELHLKNILVYFSTTIISWAAVIALATHGHPAAMIKYNFLDVAYDQWWFFASYAEEKRIFNPMQLTKLLNVYTYRPLFVLALVAFAMWRTRTIEHALLMWTGVALFAGGVVPSVGGHISIRGHISSYFDGFNFWAMMVVCIGFLRLIWLGFRKRSNLTSSFTYDSSRATTILVH